MMKNRILVFVLATVGLATAGLASTGVAQTSPLPLPPAVEKELAARASNLTEVTLGKTMLSFASKVMNGKDEDEAATRKLIDGLDGIYVREYEFDKGGEYSMEEIEKLRGYFETSEWTPIVRERERKSGETTDVMVKLVNGESHGMFILTAEPKELTIVLILGPIKMEDLGKLRGFGGLGALGDIAQTEHSKDKEKAKDLEKAKELADKAKEKADKDKKGGNQ
jgi:hypothetical protein